jgi:hypothetical protein
MLESNRPYNEIDGGVDGGRGVGFWMGAAVGMAATSNAFLGMEGAVAYKNRNLKKSLPHVTGLPPQNWRERAMQQFGGRNVNKADLEKEWNKKGGMLNNYRKMGIGKKGLIAGGIIGATSVIGGLLDNPNT